MPFYLMPSGAIATQGVNGAPVLFDEDEEDFRECCCYLQCPATLYVQVCCVGGIFSVFAGLHTVTRSPLSREYWTKQFLNVTTGFLGYLYVVKLPTIGWVVTLEIARLTYSDLCVSGGVNSVLTLKRTSAYTGECPPYDDDYAYKLDSCTMYGSCVADACSSSTGAYAEISDSSGTFTGYICQCCGAITTDYGYLDGLGAEINAADAFVTTNPEASGYGWQDFTVTGDPRNGSGATIAVDFVYENSGSGGSCGSAPNNDEPQAGFYEIVVCFNKSMTVAYSVSGNVETQDADKDFARILRDGTMKVEISSVDLDGGCTMQSGVSDTYTEISLAAGTYTFRLEVDTYDSLYHVGMVHSFLLTFT